MADAPRGWTPRAADVGDAIGSLLAATLGPMTAFVLGLAPR